MNSEEFNVIFSYTRQQALDDGVLVDVSKQAKEAGFKIPVAVTDHLYHGYVVPPKGLEGEGQSLEGRLHDLFMMTQAAAANRWKDNRVYYDVLFLTKPRTLQTVQCLAIVGPDDHGEPCMTLMLPEDE
jgi:hypothetical protein